MLDLLIHSDFHRRNHCTKGTSQSSSLVVYDPSFLPADKDNSMKRWTYSPCPLRQFFFMGCSRSHHPFINSLLLTPKVQKHPSFRSCWAAVRMCSKHCLFSNADANVGNTNIEEARGYMQKFHSAQSKARPGHKDPKLIQFLSSQWLPSPLERLWFGFSSSLVYSAQQTQPCWNALLITQPYKNY